MTVRTRLFGVLLAIVLLLAIGWVGTNTWQRLHQLHQSLTTSQIEDLYLPAYVESEVWRLNEIVFRFLLKRNEADRIEFSRTGKALLLWNYAHQDSLSTPYQRALMRRISVATDTYLNRSLRLMDDKSVAAPANFQEQIQTNSAEILGLCAQLKDSEQSEQQRFLKESERSLLWIQETLIVTSGILIVMIIVGIAAIYAGVIGPLRVELIRNRNLAIRNEKLASLGTLAAGVAHEIRNPLTAINVRLHSLKKNLTDGSSEQEDALVIGEEIQRLESIIQEFLQFARPAEPKYVTVSVDSLFARIQSLFASQLEKEFIQLKLESVPDIWVCVDPRQIEQVLINLVKNAAESMSGGGTITLRVRTGTARLKGGMQPVTVMEVSDTGKGIPDEIRKHIFDPFFTTKEKGTGLGLVIASQIIEKHNGTLECRSALNRGATFTILLPHQQPREFDELTT